MISKDTDAGQGTPLRVDGFDPNEDLCVGCGICETKCPLTDRAAVLVTSRGETRSTGVLAR